MRRQVDSELHATLEPVNTIKTRAHTISSADFESVPDDAPRGSATG